MIDEELAHYSAALDEVYRLRSILAWQAAVTEVNLGYKTFPKSRRESTIRQVEYAQAAARGDSTTVYHAISPTIMRHTIPVAGGSETLTRSEWERNRGVCE